jgi:hypothetical protein
MHNTIEDITLYIKIYHCNSFLIGTFSYLSIPFLKILKRAIPTSGTVKEKSGLIRQVTSKGDVLINVEYA